MVLKERSVPNPESNVVSFLDRLKEHADMCRREQAWRLIPRDAFIHCALTSVGIPGRAPCLGILFGRYGYLPEHHYTSADAIQVTTRSHQLSYVHLEQCSAQNEDKCCTGYP